MNEPGSTFILSSKFHRFFLKNLDPREINTRILRIENVQSSIHGDSLFGNNINYPVRKPVYNSNLKNSYTLPNAIKRPPSSYADTYFSSVRQPYQYEQVGVIDRSIVNPFTSLNTGERPESFRPQTSKFNPAQYGIVRSSNQYYKSGNNFNDLNGIRVTKSILYNSTVNH